MPQYYTGADPNVAFGNGLMQGYEFVENIRNARAARKEAAQRLALAYNADSRAQAELQINQNQDARAATSFDAAKQDRLTAIQRQNNEDAAKVFASNVAVAGGLDKLTPDQHDSIIRTTRASRPDLATATDDEIWNTATDNAKTFAGAVWDNEAHLRDIAHGMDVGQTILDMGQRNQAAAAGAAQQPGAPTLGGIAQQTARAAPNQAASGDLPDASGLTGDYADNARAGLPVGTTPTAYNPADYAPAVEPGAGSAPAAAPAPPPPAPAASVAPAAPVGTVRDQLAKVDAAHATFMDKYTHQGFRGLSADAQGKMLLAHNKAYTAERNNILNRASDQADLAAAQSHTSSAQAFYDQAVKGGDAATIAGAKAALDDSQHELRTAGDAVAKSTIGAVVKDGTAKVGDNTAGALTVAGQQMAASRGGVPTVTGSQYNANQTALNRLATTTNKRLTPKQMTDLTWGYAHGIISAEQLSNAGRFGTLDKPEKPTIQPIGDGRAAIVGPDGGISLIDFGNPKGSAEALKENEAALKENLGQLQGFFKETYGKTAQASFNDFLEQIKRAGPDIQIKSGLPLVDPTNGKLNLSYLDQGEVAYLARKYKENTDNNTGFVSWVRGFFSKDKTLSDVISQDQPNANEGWTVQLVQ